MSRSLLCFLTEMFSFHSPFLRNIASQTVARLKDVARRISSCLDSEQHSCERSASLDLLLRFQRLLVSKLYPGENAAQSTEASSKVFKSMKLTYAFGTFKFCFFVLICPFCISTYSSNTILSAPILEATFLIYYLFINLFILITLKIFIKVYFVYINLLPSCTCATHVCLVLTEVERECQIHWSWSSGWL